MKLLSLGFIPLLMFGSLSNINTNVKQTPPLPELLSYGEYLEAEDANYKNCSIIDNNVNASGREALDAGDGGSVTFSFSVEETNYYDLVVGYYTDNVGAKIAVDINGDKNSYTVQHTNGWCKDTTKYAIEYIIRDVELFDDGNVVIVSSDNIGKSKYLNFDYIRLVKSNKADGERIQFEDFYRYVGGDGYGRTYQVSENADGKVLSLDDNISAKPVYSIEIEEAGTYLVQFAYYSDSDSKYRFIINDEDDILFDQNLNISRAPGGFTNAGANYFPYSAKHIFEVELPKGKIDLSINFIRSGFIDFDWFRIYKPTTEVNTVIEAEDYTNHDANINRNEKTFPFLSGYAVELAQGYISFDIDIKKAELYRLYVAGYTATSNAYLNISLNSGAFNKFQIPEGKATGWATEISTPNVFYFTFELNEGKNNFTIKKGGDEISGNYIDLDYFMLMANRINIEKIELNKSDKSTFIVDDNIIDFASEYTLEIKNTKIAKLDGNVISAVSKGITALCINYKINGVDMIDEIPVEVEAVEFNDKSLFKVKNTTKTYNGERQFVDVEMPEGWTFTQEGDAPMAGTYIVQITFHHESYLDYVYPEIVTLTIVKGIYSGDDLFADNQKVYYDGEEHQYVASAPSDWTISYSDNGFVDIGEYEITVTFSHEFYEDVIKTAKFIIEPERNNTGNSDATPLIIALSVIGGVIVLGVAGRFIFKKYKENHEVIK